MTRRRVVWALVGFSTALLLTMGVMGCRTVSRAPVAYGTGYEGPVGYMQPDHGFFYYWMWSSLLLRPVAPSYHIYVPPAGYPASYRPWQPAIRPTLSPPTDVRRTGGFSGGDSRRTGGFSWAGRSSAATTSGSSMRSGGFSSSPSSSYLRSGGFSSSSPSSGSSYRSGGGFSGRR